MLCMFNCLFLLVFCYLVLLYLSTIYFIFKPLILIFQVRSFDGVSNLAQLHSAYCPFYCLFSVLLLSVYVCMGLGWGEGGINGIMLFNMEVRDGNVVYVGFFSSVKHFAVQSMNL